MFKFRKPSIAIFKQIKSLVTSELDQANAAKKVAEAELADLDKQISDKQKLLTTMSEQVLPAMPVSFGMRRAMHAAAEPLLQRFR